MIGVIMEDDAAVLDRLHLLSGVQFEKLCGRLFEALGYSVQYTPRSGDRGIDLELVKDDRLVLVQCKRQHATVGEPPVRDFFGVVSHRGAAKGIFCTNGTFSTRAEQWAAGTRIELLDGRELVKLWRQYAVQVPVPSQDMEPIAPKTAPVPTPRAPTKESVDRLGVPDPRRLRRAEIKWENADCEVLGIPRPASPGPVDGDSTKRLYCGPDGKGGWVLVHAGKVLAEGTTQGEVKREYDRVKHYC